jgi:hypothetical protein
MANQKKTFEQERFEFMFRINGHPICQRYFDIRNFNEDCLDSMELKEMMDNIAGMSINDFGEMGIIPNFLKAKTREYLWGYYNPHKPQKEDEINRKDIFEKEDVYTFEFRVDNKTVAISHINGNYFPPKVRYQVNIKDIIPKIISEIRQSMSKKAITPKYGEITLKSELAPYNFEV